VGPELTWHSKHEVQMHQMCGPNLCVLFNAVFPPIQHIYVAQRVLGEF
jgi:hypothetical protein